MTLKVWITVEGGIVQSVYSNMDMDIVVTDYDNQSETPVSISGIQAPDRIFEDGKAHDILNYQLTDTRSEHTKEAEQEVKQFLIENNF